jgi:formylmethanofuran dehydrogenase subunit B
MSIAIEELAKLIKKSKSILFAGMGTDTKGTKVSLDILDKFGGTIDHFSGDSYSKNLKSIQEIGGVYITLAELKNRCDTIIIIETTDQTVPRLFEE